MLFQLLNTAKCSKKWGEIRLRLYPPNVRMDWPIIIFRLYFFKYLWNAAGRDENGHVRRMNSRMRNKTRWLKRSRLRSWQVGKWVIRNRGPPRNHDLDLGFSLEFRNWKIQIGELTKTTKRYLMKNSNRKSLFSLWAYKHAGLRCSFAKVNDLIKRIFKIKTNTKEYKQFFLSKYFLFFTF